MRLWVGPLAGALEVLEAFLAPTALPSPRPPSALKKERGEPVAKEEDASSSEVFGKERPFLEPLRDADRRAQTLYLRASQGVETGAFFFWDVGDGVVGDCFLAGFSDPTASLLTNHPTCVSCHVSGLMHRGFRSLWTCL